MKRAVEAALREASEHASIQDRLRKLRAENPLPAATGNQADKAFFDDLSGGL